MAKKHCFTHDHHEGAVWKCYDPNGETVCGIVCIIRHSCTTGLKALTNEAIKFLNGIMAEKLRLVYAKGGTAQKYH